MTIWVSNQSWTKAHTVSRIVSMMGAGPYYFSLSRTMRWSNPPPVPLPTDTLVPGEVLAYKKAYEVLGALQNPCGERELSINGQKSRWSLVPASDIILLPDGTYTPNVTHLYISLLMEEADHMAAYVNVIGLHTGLTLTPDANPDAVVFPPPTVVGSGTLHWLAYSSPLERVPRLTQVVAVLTSF